MKKLFVSLIAALSTAFASVSAFAQTTTTPTAGPDFTSLTSSLSATTTVTAVMAVAAFLVLIFLAVRGAKIVLSMIRGG